MWSVATSHLGLELTICCFGGDCSEIGEIRESNDQFLRVKTSGHPESARVAKQHKTTMLE